MRLRSKLPLRLALWLLMSTRLLMVLRRTRGPEIKLLGALARLARELRRRHIPIHIAGEFGPIAIGWSTVLPLLAHAAITAGTTTTPTTATAA
jgi:hypothetical protein